MFSSDTTNVNDQPDPQFNYVTMLLHGDGTNGAQNNTFLDSSTNNFTITRNGNTTQGSFSPYGSNWSNYFAGATNYFSLSATPTQFGTGDFTVEGWINHSTTTTSTFVGLSPYDNGGWAFGVHFPSLGDLYFYDGTGLVLSYSGISANTWYHVAVARSGASIKMFVNGTQVATASASGRDYYASTSTLVGTDYSGQNFRGYISNIRVVKGTALYTSSFTPSTTPLTAVSGTSLLTCQSNRFIDNSTNNYAITVTGAPSVQRFNPFGASTAYSTSVIGGSGYFDGSGDYLTIGNPAVNSALDFGAGDFTIEAWVRPNSTGPMLVVGSLDNSSGNGSWWFVINGTFGGGSTLQFGYNVTAGGSGIGVLRGTGTLPVNTWNHVAVTRSGSNIRMYLNGSQLGSTYTGIGSDPIYPVNQNFLVGETVAGPSYGMNGYISDVRLLKGTALYTSSTYTIPTAPLTAITNTSRLLNFTNGAIFDNAMMNDLETVGNAQISTSVVKYGTGSMYFDGTGDWLISQNSPNLQFNTGDFTVEMWVYTSNLAAYQTLIDNRNADTQSAWGVFIDNTGKPFWYDASGAQTSSTALSSNTWTHLAVARSGSTIKIFLAGTQVFSGTNSNSQNATGSFVVGRNIAGTVTYTGYIDDLRITKGYARYTANFTPPSAAFPNTGPI